MNKSINVVVKLKNIVGCAGGRLTLAVADARAFGVFIKFGNPLNFGGVYEVSW